MLIGRKEEIRCLEAALKDDRPHFIAVYGRRRVGKTFLIREFFGDRFTFQHSGLFAGKMNDELNAFRSSLHYQGYDPKRMFCSWLEAFDGLRELIAESREKRKVIFLDEISWMDTPKSDFMMALEHFWNGYASARKDVILIVCASATSWILSKVIHNKGGLYNRLTDQIALHPFTLKECEEYVKAAGLTFPREQILKFYMVFGGIPYYWEFIQKGQSFSQNVDRILFSENAPLKEEFKYLFASVFKQPAPYLKIVRALSEKKAGMSREEIIAASGLANSGSLSERLSELESCGFLRKYYAFGKKKKEAVYQLIDPFVLFCFRFLKEPPDDEHFFSNQLNTPAINTWMGLAFERICLLHVNGIKKKLGVSGVLTEACSWSCRADAEKGLYGSQIDLLLVRRDQVINLCEIKYSASEYQFTKKSFRELQQKIQDFMTASGTKYAVFPTLVTTYGIVENVYDSAVQAVVTADDLF